MDRRERSSKKRSNKSRAIQKYEKEAERTESLETEIKREKIAQKKMADEMNLLWLSSSALHHHDHAVLKTCTGCEKCQSSGKPDLVCFTLAVNKT